MSSAVGFFIGGLTVAGVYTLYPPARDQSWPIPALAAASALLVLGLYLGTARLGVLRAGDWLVLGYTLALVVAAVLVVARELFTTVRAHVPESLGVKTGAVAYVKWCG